MKKQFDVVQAIRDVQHFGEEGGVVPVVDVAATSTFLNPKDMERAFHGEIAGCYLYSRHSNPSVIAFSKKLAAMENMEAAIGVSSGMAAINCAIQQSMPDGGHMISSRTVYGGSYALFKNVLPKSNIQTTFVDIDDFKSIEAAITKNTKVLYTETLSNPLLRISNLKKLGELARKHKLKFIVDNTFTPVIVTPQIYGADVVVYSCTKYISGASDLIAGAIVSSQDFINQLIDLNTGQVMVTGPVMDSRVAHELYLRMDHLPLRMLAHSKSAAFLAQKMLEAKINVVYPGLKNHPNHSLCTELMNTEFGFGGMLTIDCQNEKRAMNLAAALQYEKFGLVAVSLGFSRTLMSCPSVSTSSEIPRDEQEKMKLSSGLLRLSIGFTGNDHTMWERFYKCYAQLAV